MSSALDSELNWANLNANKVQALKYVCQQKKITLPANPKKADYVKALKAYKDSQMKVKPIVNISREVTPVESLCGSREPTPQRKSPYASLHPSREHTPVAEKESVSIQGGAVEYGKYGKKSDDITLLVLLFFLFLTMSLALFFYVQLQ